MKSKSNEKTEQFLKMFQGNISETCRQIGISRKTFYTWKEKNKDFAEAIDEKREEIIDYVESRLMQKISEGDLTAIIFFLKTIGRDRGYIESKRVDARVQKDEGNDRIIIE